MPGGALLVLSFEKNTFVSQGGTVYVKDTSGKENHGEVHGAVPTQGKAGAALLFDGKDDFVHLPSLRRHLIQDLKAITICAWVQPTKARGVVFGVGAFPNSVAIVVGDSAAFFLPSADGVVRLSSSLPADNQWNHVAGTWDGTQQSLYIDGQRVANEPVGNFVLNAQTVPVWEARIGSPDKRVGSPDKVKGRAATFFGGGIDELAIFGRALSEEEIRSIFRMGQAGKPLGD
jgi:hypothetical protein